jgi:nucleoid-associated protein YgaU
MRKDVKFGLTIGGILVVTLVIYVIVLSRGPAVPQHLGITLQQPTDQTASTVDNTSSAPRDLAKVEGDATTDANAPLTDSTNSNSVRAQTPTETSTTPAFNPPATRPTSTANASSDWDNALNNGLPPPLSAPQHTETPTLESSSSTNARAGVARPPTVPMIDAFPTTQPTRSVASGISTGGTPFSSPTLDSTSTATPAPLYASAAPATPSNSVPTIDPSSAAPAQAPSSTPRTHRVQSGESPYSIAQSIYGNGKYYKLILAANPKVDPHHLRIGQVLTIPELRDSDKSAGISSARATPSAAIDPSNQYTVASGDTLDSISRKLYGNAAFVDKLYQLNKSLIGADENVLKVGWVLKLPQPPSESGGSGEVRGN